MTLHIAPPNTQMAEDVLRAAQECADLLNKTQYIVVERRTWERVMPSENSQVSDDYNNAGAQPSDLRNKSVSGGAGGSGGAAAEPVAWRPRGNPGVYRWVIGKPLDMDLSIYREEGIEYAYAAPPCGSTRPFGVDVLLANTDALLGGEALKYNSGQDHNLDGRGLFEIANQLQIALRAALRADTPPAPALEYVPLKNDGFTYALLIERQHEGRTEYWAGFGWEQDAEQALWFMRRRDANVAFMGLKDDSAKIEWHAFDLTQPKGERESFAHGALQNFRADLASPQTPDRPHEGQPRSSQTPDLHHSASDVGGDAKDAARYRWLRPALEVRSELAYSRTSYIRAVLFKIGKGHLSIRNEKHEPTVDGDKLDAAIDAAMAAARGDDK